MSNKIGLSVAIATLPLIQSVSFAQDSSLNNTSIKTYSIRGVAWTSEITGNFTVSNLNNDEFIDKSELSDFTLNFNYENTKVSCTLPALTKFQISDSKLRTLALRPIPASLLSLELTCQSKDAEFSLSGSQLKGKLKIIRNLSQSSQSSNSIGMQTTYSTGISSEKLEFDIPVYSLQINQINQPSAQIADVETVSLNKSFILTEGKTVNIYTNTLRGLVTGYKISMLNSKNNRAEIKIAAFEEYPLTLSNTVGHHTLSLSESNTITPSKLILGDGYALRFVSFTSSGVELIVVYAR